MFINTEDPNGDDLPPVFPKDIAWDNIIDKTNSTFKLGTLSEESRSLEKNFWNYSKQLKPSSKGTRRNTQDKFVIYFKNDESALDEEDMKTLKTAANWLSLDDNMTATLTGNTNRDASKTYNKKLGQKRANSTMEQMTEELNVDNPLTTHSNGETNANQSAKTDTDRNVTVEITFPKKGE